MVLHPKNPYIPTVHLNYRYFEAGPVWWFGGGADLTPFYPYLSDVRNFHEEHKKACEKVDNDLHKVFKPWCDEYFFLKHRNESRGIGGFFMIIKMVQAKFIEETTKMERHQKLHKILANLI